MSIEQYIFIYVLSGAISTVLWISFTSVNYLTLGMVILRFVLWPYFSTRDSIKGSRKAWRSLHKE